MTTQQISMDSVVVGRSARMRAVFEFLRVIGNSDSTVLVTGESGTGKELVARRLHALSTRHAQPFVVLHCGAVPRQLVESELFGHVRGAFTGADQKRLGLFDAAHGGTLFLDEVGELPLEVQPALLRAVQFGEIRAVGADTTRTVDVRIVAATHRDLHGKVQDGSFREDLFYRLAVLEIAVPPLRDRAEDIVPLCEHFLRQAAERSHKRITGLSPQAAKLLLAHPFPGNVRELENVIERAVALSEGPLITPLDLPQAVRERRTSDLISSAAARGLTLQELEREYILRVVKDEGGNKTKAAQRLGLDRKTLYRKLEEAGRLEDTLDDEPGASGPPSQPPRDPKDDNDAG